MTKRYWLIAGEKNGEPFKPYVLATVMDMELDELAEEDMNLQGDTWEAVEIDKETYEAFQLFGAEGVAHLLDQLNLL